MLSSQAITAIEQPSPGPYFWFVGPMYVCLCLKHGISTSRVCVPPPGWQMGCSQRWHVQGAGKLWRKSREEFSVFQSKLLFTLLRPPWKEKRRRGNGGCLLVNLQWLPFFTPSSYFTFFFSSWLHSLISRNLHLSQGECRIAAVSLLGCCCDHCEERLSKQSSASEADTA